MDWATKIVFFFKLHTINETISKNENFSAVILLWEAAHKQSDNKLHFNGSRRSFVWMEKAKALCAHVDKIETKCDNKKR